MDGRGRMLREIEKQKQKLTVKTVRKREGDGGKEVREL